MAITKLFAMLAKSMSNGNCFPHPFTRVYNAYVLYPLMETATTAEIPFIFNTSNSENVDWEKALQSGADGYIIKPFEVEAK